MAVLYINRKKIKEIYHEKLKNPSFIEQITKITDNKCMSIKNKNW